MESLFLKLFRIYRATNSLFTKDKVHCQISRWISVDLHTKKMTKEVSDFIQKNISDALLLDVT
jgi:hypothetical protein